MSSTPRWQPGSRGELLHLAWPLILSTSIWTLQATIDRIFLSWLGSDAVAASMPAVLLFWTPFTLLQNTSNYATTFVAQYIGAGRPHRVGPAVWQALHFSWAAGLLFLLFIPAAPQLVAWGGHSEEIQQLEVIYFRCFCFAALPMLLTASACSFFAGKGQSRMILLINVAGLVTNSILDYLLILGNWGFPALGMAGAGWATVAGTSVSALLALILLFQREYRQDYATLSSWRLERDLFSRLIRFGLPTGILWCFDALAWTLFVILVGRLGEAELAATSIAFTINMVAFMPVMGLSQAISILVGQRLGEDRPDLAERTTWIGFRVSWLFMACMAVLYLFTPGLFLALFQHQGDQTAEQMTHVSRLVVVILRFVAVYSLLDCMNLVFAFALRGAGDTRFVTVVSLALAWPILIIPTWAAWYYQWGIYWAWTFASGYVIALALMFLFRFRRGKWKSMRVIEPVVVESVAPETAILLPNSQM